MTRHGSSSRAGSVAVICLLPDYGHLQPLLKIADALAEGGFEIKCYVPEECAPLMRRFRFDFELFPNAQLSEQKQLLARVFARGLFFNAACSYVHYLLCYPRIAEAASGAVGLQTMLPAALRLIHNGEMDFKTLIRAISTRPAELLGLPGGTLRAGSPADLVVIDPDTPWVLDPADLKSQCKNTPFDEARFSGRVVRTIVGGRTVYEHV